MMMRMKGPNRWRWGWRCRLSSVVIRAVCRGWWDTWGECVTQIAPGGGGPCHARGKDKALLPQDCHGLATVSIASRRLSERQQEELIELIEYQYWWSALVIFKHQQAGNQSECGQFWAGAKRKKQIPGLFCYFNTVTKIFTLGCFSFLFYSSF